MARIHPQLHKLKVLGSVCYITYLFSYKSDEAIDGAKFLGGRPSRLMELDGSVRAFNNLKIVFFKLKCVRKAIRVQLRIQATSSLANLYASTNYNCDHHHSVTLKSFNNFTHQRNLVSKSCVYLYPL